MRYGCSVCSLRRRLLLRKRGAPPNAESRAEFASGDVGCFRPLSPAQRETNGRAARHFEKVSKFELGDGRQAQNVPIGLEGRDDGAVAAGDINETGQNFQKLFELCSRVF